VPDGRHSELRLGIGAERINPPLGVPLPIAYTGGGEPIVVKGRHDDCWARALVLEQCDTRLAVVSVDLCTMRNDQYQDIVDRIVERCGIPDACVSIACTHNHSNAPLLEPFGTPPSPWQETLNDLIVSAVYQACQDLQPVARIRHGTAEFGKVAYNRRVVLPEAVCMLIGAEPRWEGILEQLAERLGTSREQLGAPSGPVHPQGIVDNTLRLVVFEGGTGKTLASIVSAACHPVTHSLADGYTCADYPGQLVALAEQELGGMALFLQGCSGDVRTRYREPTYAEVQRVGREFGSALLAAASNLCEVEGQPSIDTMKREIELPLKPYSSNEQQRARLTELETELEDYPKNPVSSAEEIRERWSVSHEHASLRYQMRWSDLEIDQADLQRERVAATLQAVRIGNILVLTSPAEVFAETGISLSAWAEEQGWDGSIIASCTNGYINYIPPQAEAERGGFEPSCTSLAPGSCEQMVATLKTLGQQVKV
jgi:hypothetical protein